jgi:hypothetical protein
MWVTKQTACRALRAQAYTPVIKGTNQPKHCVLFKASKPPHSIIKCRVPPVPNNRHSLWVKSHSSWGVPNEAVKNFTGSTAASESINTPRPRKLQKGTNCCQRNTRRARQQVSCTHRVHPGHAGCACTTVTTPATAPQHKKMTCRPHTQRAAVAAGSSRLRQNKKQEQAVLAVNPA